MSTVVATASSEGRDRQVPGRIDVVTERPIVLPRQDGARARVEELMDRRPWLVPGLLVGVIALLLLREPRRA